MYNCASLDNGDTITNPSDVVNTLIITYLASITETMKKKVKYSHQHFSGYLSNESSSTIFLQPTDKDEIANIISSLNFNKVPTQKVYLIEYYFF